MRRKAAAIDGSVAWFDREVGWGAVISPVLPSGCFVHFSHIQMEGYRYLDEGQAVRFTYLKPGFLQDGYEYSAVKVWPVDV